MIRSMREQLIKALIAHAHGDMEDLSETNGTRNRK